MFKKVLSERGEDAALQAAALMQQARMIDLDSGLAMQGAVISHEMKLSMADGIILATARKHRATVWTQDTDFQNLKEVKFKPKPPVK